ncbi:MaoC family dehydratase [Desulfocicer niacini]
MQTNKPYKMFLDDFQVGQIYKHYPPKTITESDNNLFCLLTMNHHPIHSDFELARKSQHGQILVVGTYVLSLVVGMSVPEISGAAIANLEYEKVAHIAPVFIGDTICAESKILEVRQSKSKADRGIIYVETAAFNQKKEQVITLRRRVLLPKKI